MDVNSLAHTKWDCKYHIVFAPKYRCQVIYKDIKADVGQILGTLCRRKGIEIIEAEYAGKMQLYLTALDEQIKLPDENPSIGIIICKSKDKTYVEYALKNINMPIGVATYQLRNTLPEEMKEMLPEPEEIVKRLKVFEKL